MLTSWEIIIIISVCLSHAFQNERTCRLSRKEDNLTQDEFNRLSCKFCYKYIVRDDGIADLDALFENQTYPEMLFNKDVIKDIKNDRSMEQWRKCCREAETCCNIMLNATTNLTEPHCPKTWDGWLCWEDSPPGKHEILCPSYSYTNLRSCANANAIKQCGNYGEWEKKSVIRNGTTTWMEYTDYTNCEDIELLKRRVVIKLTSYLISLVTLLPALIILFSYRALTCRRIKVHKSFLLSMLLHSILEVTIIFSVDYNQDYYEVIERNGLFCKCLTILSQYFRICNYLWMFCNGLNSHLEIVEVFRTISSWVFYTIGWVIPLIPVFIFLLYHSLWDNKNCWMTPGHIDWALHTPCLLCLIINFSIYLNILRVVIHLVRQTRFSNRERYLTAQRGFQAGLMLLPLFGLNFWFTIYRNESVCTVLDEYYSYLNCMQGLQGFLVAIVCCYANKEVQVTIVRKWKNIRELYQLNNLQPTNNTTVVTSSDTLM